MTDQRRERLDRLDQPIEPGRVRLPRFDPEAFGRWSESIARYMGTAKFIVYMTILIGAWFAWNTLAPSDMRFDPYTFTFLTLILSLQASYAAPLILLAQNRQEARDRVSLDQDRRVADQSRADMDFLARELASLRMRINDMPTRDFLRDQLREVTEDIVARTAEGASEAIYDRQKRIEREERERRAERKRRREAQREAQRSEEQPAAAGLGDPFVGDEEDR